MDSGAPHTGQTGGVVMALTETLVGGAIAVGVTVAGVGAHMWRRLSVLETHREHDAQTLADIKDDVKGIDSKLDTVIMGLGLNKKGR